MGDIRLQPTTPTPCILEGRVQNLQGIYEESSTQRHEIGQRLALSDGRVFYYALNSSTAITRAGVMLAADCDATEAEETLTVAHAIGDKEITFTAVASITRSQYRNGYFIVNDGTGKGMTYTIDDNDAITAASTGKIYLREPLYRALDTTSDVQIHENPFYKVAVAGDEQDFCLGVPLIGITASYYFWVQTYGYAVVIAPSSAIGTEDNERIINPGASAVTCSITAKGINAAVGGKQILGTMLTDSADLTASEGEMVFLSIWP